MALISIVVAIFYIMTVESQMPAVYRCAPDQDCVVNCTNPGEAFDCNPSNRSAQIRGENATNLHVICYEKDACGNLRVECPIANTQNNNRECIVQCDLDNSCSSLEIWTHNVAKVDLRCGTNLIDQEIATEIQCKDIIIEGKYDVAELPPLTQHIIIQCNDEGLPDIIPVCQNIVTKNLGAFDDGRIPNNEVALTLICGTTADAAGIEARTCDNFQINGGKVKFVDMLIAGDITNSNLTFNDLGVLEVYIELVFYGTIINSTISAKYVQHKFKFNTTSNEGMRNTQIYGPIQNDRSSFIVNGWLESQMVNVYWEGRFVITGTLNIIDSVLNGGYGADSHNITALFWQNSDLLIQNVINSSYIQFNGIASGTINMTNNNDKNGILNYKTTIICNSATPSLSCDNLELIIPSYTLINNNVRREHVFLECLGYGCQEITTFSLNGAGDLSISATHCDCNHGGNSCIGDFIIFCGDNLNEEVTFDGIKCLPSNNECCGLIESSTNNVKCNNNNNSSALSGGEVVGVIIGILLGILMIIFLLCYIQNQRTLKYQFKSFTNVKTKNKNNKNPYTQKIVDDDNNDNKNNDDDNNIGGYGAVTDDK